MKRFNIFAVFAVFNGFGSTLGRWLFGPENRTLDRAGFIRPLTALLVVLLLFSVGPVLLLGALRLPSVVWALAILVGVVLPGYILARRGHVQSSAIWVALTFAAFMVLYGWLDTGSQHRYSPLFNYTVPLLFTPVLAALVIQPKLILVTVLANSLAIGLLYHIWQAVQPQIDQNSNVLTGLTVVMLTELIIGVICLLLTQRLLTIIAEASEQTALLNAILEALPVGVAVYPADDQPVPRFCNPQFVALTGVSATTGRTEAKRETHQITEQDNLAVPTVPADEWPWQTARRTPIEGESNATVSHAAKQTIELHEEISKICDDQGHLQFILYVATDISNERLLTERIRQLYDDTEAQRQKLDENNQQLTQLDRLKGEFLANVSHELRTPLQIIMINGENLQRAHPAGSAPAANVEAIQNAAEQLRALVNDILDAAKLESNQLLIDKQLIDLREPIQNATKGMEALAVEKQLRLHLILPKQPVLVVGDERRLAQITLNLLSNAVKFTPRGSVTIEIKVGPDAATLVVQDTGIGIDPKVQDYLFERFVQIRSNGLRRSGTGLGLSIARSLAELHDGQVWLEKSAPDQGSTFICRIPLAIRSVSDSAALTTSITPITPS